MSLYYLDRLGNLSYCQLYRLEGPITYLALREQSLVLYCFSDSLYYNLFYNLPNSQKEGNRSLSFRGLLLLSYLSRLQYNNYIYLLKPPRVLARAKAVFSKVSNKLGQLITPSSEHYNRNMVSSQGLTVPAHSTFNISFIHLYIDLKGANGPYCYIAKVLIQDI